MNMAGLMIETHLTPDEAWSDAKQQITPTRLIQILDRLVVREKDLSNPKTISKLENLRTHIDEVDEKLLNILLDIIRSLHFQVYQLVGHNQCF